jgi:uncharacterized repeat protein (TIGR03803 family)
MTTVKACGLFLACVIPVAALSAQTFKPSFRTLHSFDNTDGNRPLATLVQGADGNLYGTTGSGGDNGNNVGTVFKITPGGTLTTIYTFCSRSNCTDGASPVAALLEGADGNFYGTTYYGGARGEGTGFKITTSGTLTTLYSFCSQHGCADGDQPAAALVQGRDGNFYGTTEYGGADMDGEVFKITPSGALSILHSFHATDGLFPYAGLVLGNDGDFYGTTGYGGANSRYGTVYKITSAGELTTLHSFDGTDGSYIFAGLTQGTDGNFYGTASQGGANNAGTVFKITPSGTLTTLHNFDVTDGWYPYAAMVQGSDQEFYGTTSEGGANNDGTVFKITSTGTLTTLHSFNTTDGAAPYAGLIQASNRTFYGTTASGGTNNDGTVFSLSVVAP